MRKLTTGVIVLLIIVLGVFVSMDIAKVYKSNRQDAVIATFPETDCGDKVKTLITVKDIHAYEAAEIVEEVGNVEIKKDYQMGGTVSADVTPEEAKELLNDKRIEAVEPDTEVTLNADDSMWGFERIEAAPVQAKKFTGVHVAVAVIDTGIDMNHPALQKVYAGGYDLVNADDKPFDDNFHGTHCAGIIAAQLVNNAHMFGVAPDVKIYALKVLDSNGVGNYSNIISALQWCVNNKINIVSMSFSATRHSIALCKACETAKAAGITLVAAAGNNGEGKDTIGYPARYDSVISVGAIDPDGERASYSSTGKEIDVAAPGTDILSTCPDKSYFKMSGTSMATPFVAGTAALLYSSGITSPDSIYKKLTETATEAGPSGFDNSYGYGVINARAAVLNGREKDLVALGINFEKDYVIAKQLANYWITWGNTSDEEDCPITIQIKDLTYNVTLMYGVITVEKKCTQTILLTRKFSAIGKHKLEFRIHRVNGETNYDNNIITTEIEVRN